MLDILLTILQTRGIYHDWLSKFTLLKHFILPTNSDKISILLVYGILISIFSLFRNRKGTFAVPTARSSGDNVWITKRDAEQLQIFFC